MSAPLLPATEPTTKEETAEATQLDRGWNVIVWDDPINLMDYVVYVFQSLLGMSKPKATKHMLEVHETGRSLVASTDREQAEYYVTRLHLFGLQATMDRAESR